MTTTQLTPIAEGVWEARADLLSAGKAIHFPLRMTVLSRPDGGLVLVSPVPIDDALHAELAALGQVRDILAPNGFHHLHAAAALDRFPSAQLWLAPCLVDKRPDLSARGRVLSETPPAWGPALSVHRIDGAPKLDELVVLHRPSGTLVTTDLVFHMHDTRGWMMPLVLRMSGAWKRLAQSRLMRSMLKDRDAARASLQALLSLDFDRLVMAHGDIIETGGREALGEALRWIVPAPEVLALRAGA